jgi:hypothetical protein
MQQLAHPEIVERTPEKDQGEVALAIGLRVEWRAQPLCHLDLLAQFGEYTAGLDNPQCAVRRPRPKYGEEFSHAIEEGCMRGPRTDLEHHYAGAGSGRVAKHLAKITINVTSARLSAVHTSNTVSSAAPRNRSLTAVTASWPAARMRSAARRLRFSSSLNFTPVFGGHGNDALSGCFGAVCDCRQDVFVRQPRILIEQFGLSHVLGKKIEDQRDPNPGPFYARFAAANSWVYRNSLQKRVHAVASHAFAGGSPAILRANLAQLRRR